MADKTPIEWTDATWNPITGCSVHGPGCKHCYAMLLAGTRLQRHPSRAGLTVDTKAGPVWTGEVRFNEQWLTEPLRWKRPRRIFVVAHGDLFHEAVPDAWIDRVFAAMALCPQHQFQVLTKRADRMRAYVTALLAKQRSVFSNAGESPIGYCTAALQSAFSGVADPDAAAGAPWRPLPNVWLGVSVENQQAANERVPDLLATPAAVRWLSCEPLLGPILLSEAWHGESALNGDCWGECGWCPAGFPPLHNCQSGRQSEAEYEKGRSGIDWVVAGGESGREARPAHPEWFRLIRDECADAGVPFLFKQWGGWRPVEATDDFDTSSAEALPRALMVNWDGTVHRYRETSDEGAPVMLNVGKAKAGRLLDSVEHNGFPA